MEPVAGSPPGRFYAGTMFTGIVECTGIVRALQPSPAGRELLIDAGGWGVDFAPGESISVSGCCLTLAPKSGMVGGDSARPGSGGGLLRFDVIPETLAMTTLGSLGPGARVNLERSATPTTLLGGHIVQGHVEGLGSISEIKSAGEWRVKIHAPAELMPCVTPKGSITVDGVSLTIASVDVSASTFDVALIPTTLDVTTLGALTPGSRVNLETDAMARAVIHYLRNYARD